MPRFPRSFHLAALVLILPTLTGCTSWQTVDQPVPEVVEAYPGKRVRIELSNGVVFSADSASIRSDSLVAWHESGSMVPVVEIHPLVKIRTIEVRRSDRVNTIYAIAGVALLVTVVYVVATFPQIPFGGGEWARE